jgi:hypothetical protein
MQMPPNANIPYEYQVGFTQDDKLAIVVPSWGQKDKLSYLVLMDRKTRELTCECEGFKRNNECHHVHGIVWWCAGRRHRKRGMQPSSLDAWKSIQADLGQKQRAVLKALQEIGEASNKQISNLLGWPINTITPKVLELRHMGLVDFSREQVDLKTNRTEIVWRAV